MKGPDRINVTKTGWSAEGTWDANTAFQATYVRKDLAERSKESHNHEFAEINELFQNLPEHLSEQPYAASASAFRKHGLIETGHCDTLTFFYRSQGQARKESPTNKHVLMKVHGYAIGSGAPTDDGGFAVVYKVPHSQSMAAMGKPAFQQSKSDVLNWAKGIVGV